ncbi:MAG TPA: TIGR02147 family protein [Bdellovibrionales bacterium]|nr:TIGR02147 family protein [Bdellovibrionales bacterium]
MDFRSFLVQALKTRQEKNANYSMRAYARDLGISPQKLNQVLTGRSGLSPRSAEQIAKRLSLPQNETDIFVALVEAKHHRSKFARAAALERIEELRSDMSVQTIEANELKSMSDWYHWAAYVLVDLAAFRPDYDWIAGHLGITPALARKAYDDLFSLGLIRQEENGRWVRDAAKFQLRSRQPSAELRNFYRQLWDIAERTLDSKPMAERDFSAIMLSVGLDDLEFVKQEIDVFQKSLIEKISRRPGNAEAVYGLALQFFPVAQAAEVS